MQFKNKTKPKKKAILCLYGLNSYTFLHFGPTGSERGRWSCVEEKLRSNEALPETVFLRSVQGDGAVVIFLLLLIKEKEHIVFFFPSDSLKK